MMKQFSMATYGKIAGGIALSLLLAGGIPGSAFAAAPTLSLSSVGNDSVQLGVNGDPNSSVLFYYNVGSASGMQVVTLGSTTSGGSFSLVMSTGSYNINPGSLVYVVVDGQQSPMQTWPYIGGSTGAPSLNPASLSLSVGQSSAVTVQGSSNSVYVAANSIPSVASFSVNGTQITVFGNQSGSTTATICYVNSAANCASLYITVQAGDSQGLAFGENNITLGAGQSISVSVSGGQGNYIVNSNTNVGAVQASVSGSSVTVTAVGSSGTAAIEICSSGTSTCGTLTVNAGTSGSSVSFSQSNVSLSSGGSASVSIYGGASSVYFVSSNSNPSAVGASISGTTIVLTGSATGSATITVCAQSGGCGTVFASVNGGTGGSISFDQSSPTIAVGQIITVNMYGGTGYYISSNSNSSVASPSLNGNAVVISGNENGSTVISVCSATNGCGSITVNVGSGGSISSIVFGQTNPTVAVGQIVSVSVSGGSGSYYISSSANNIVQASLNGATLTLTGEALGSSSVVVCSSSGCGTLSVTVANSAPSSATTQVSQTTIEGILAEIQSLETALAAVKAQVLSLEAASGISTAPASSASDGYKFENELAPGSVGNDVSELQKRLTAEGVYSGPVNGSFGPLTEAGVKQYQKLHGLSQLGIVGPGTRSALNGD